MNRFLWQLIAVVVLAAGLALFFWKSEEASVPQSQKGAHQITLTEDGFVPNRLTIQRGEAVSFSTTRGKLFWPASNLHPSHLEYSDFDPKTPVTPDSAWSFTFEKAGEWEYHDHLAPYFTGVIIVHE